LVPAERDSGLGASLQQSWRETAADHYAAATANSSMLADPAANYFTAAGDCSSSHLLYAESAGRTTADAVISGSSSNSFMVVEPSPMAKASFLREGGLEATPRQPATSATTRRWQKQPITLAAASRPLIQLGHADMQARYAVDFI
jgi:hypothetical protein